MSHELHLDLNLRLQGTDELLSVLSDLRDIANQRLEAELRLVDQIHLLRIALRPCPTTDFPVTFRATITPL